MMAIFLLKYRIEYLVVIPLFIALFAAYMQLALTPDSAAARPEELMRQPAMLIGAAVTMGLFGVLTFVDLPWLNGLTSSDLIHLGLAADMSIAATDKASGNMAGVRLGLA